MIDYVLFYGWYVAYAVIILFPVVVALREFFHDIALKRRFEKHGINDPKVQKMAETSVTNFIWLVASTIPLVIGVFLGPWIGLAFFAAIFMLVRKLSSTVRRRFDDVRDK